MEKMTGNEFTPGPWGLQKFAIISDQWIFSLRQPRPVGDIICRAPERGQNESLRQWEANAKLISAAPELLEALIGAKRFITTLEKSMPAGDWKDGMSAGIKIMESAINKATKP